MTNQSKEALIAQFSDYLSRCDLESCDEGRDDAFSVLVELTALKSEVKHHSRHVKEALDEFKSVFTTVEESNRVLNAEVARYQKQGEAQKHDEIRAFLLHLLEVHDHLEAVLAVPLPRPGWSFTAWFSRRERAWIEANREGQAMIYRRFVGMLAKQNVVAFPTVGQVFDPHRMRVIETVQHQGVEDGVVVDESRKGFFWGDELLRLAEVSVNKSNGST